MKKVELRRGSLLSDLSVMTEPQERWIGYSAQVHLEIVVNSCPAIGEKAHGRGFCRKRVPRGGTHSQGQVSLIRIPGAS